MLSPTILAAVNKVPYAMWYPVTEAPEQSCKQISHATNLSWRLKGRYPTALWFLIDLHMLQLPIPLSSACLEATLLHTLTDFLSRAACNQRWLCSYRMQAKLQQLGCLGATPKDLGAIALAALINWQVSGASTPFQACHLTAAIQQYLNNMDGRVRWGFVQGVSIDNCVAGTLHCGWFIYLKNIYQSRKNRRES